MMKKFLRKARGNKIEKLAKRTGMGTNRWDNQELPSPTNEITSGLGSININAGTSTTTTTNNPPTGH